MIAGARCRRWKRLSLAAEVVKARAPRKLDFRHGLLCVQVLVDLLDGLVDFGAAVRPAKEVCRQTPRFRSDAEHP